MLLTTLSKLPTTFSQGDLVTLNLAATDDAGNPINITGATFSTEILGANSVGPVVFGNTQHSVISGPGGTFSLTLSQADTANCGLGQHKEILTTITIGGAPQIYRGVNLLTVYPGVPTQ